MNGLSGIVDAREHELLILEKRMSLTTVAMLIKYTTYTMTATHKPYLPASLTDWKPPRAPFLSSHQSGCPKPPRNVVFNPCVGYMASAFPDPGVSATCYVGAAGSDIRPYSAMGDRPYFFHV